MDADLVKAAVTAITAAFAKPAAEAAVAGGGKIWLWLKTRLAGADAETAKAIEAEPGKASMPSRLQGILLDVLQSDPAAAEALQRLLAEADGPAVAQTATIGGDNGRVVQISGSGNNVSTR
jgi:hypothetical protein